MEINNKEPTLVSRCYPAALERCGIEANGEYAKSSWRSESLLFWLSCGIWKEFLPICLYD